MKRHAFLAAGAAALTAGCAGRDLLPSGSPAGSPRSAARLFPAKALPTVPIVGEVRRFDGKRAPRGWMPCDGRSLRVAEYPQLYAVLGHSAGRAPKGSFKLPQRQALGFVIAFAGVRPTSRRVVEAVMARRSQADPAVTGKPARAVRY